jgi:hypothetical protein
MQKTMIYPPNASDSGGIALTPWEIVGASDALMGRLLHPATVKTGLPMRTGGMCGNLSTGIDSTHEGAT